MNDRIRSASTGVTIGIGNRTEPTTTLRVINPVSTRTSPSNVSAATAKDMMRISVTPIDIAVSASRNATTLADELAVFPVRRKSSAVSEWMTEIIGAAKEQSAASDAIAVATTT